MSNIVDTTLGDLIAALYGRYLEQTGDPELASVATAASVHEVLAARELASRPKRAAA